MKKIALVIPWYGADIPGGAEALCRNLVQHLYENSINVEVLTTCVKDFSGNWNKNYYKPDRYTVNNIIVRRFPVQKRNVIEFDKVNWKLINKVAITEEEEKIFFKEMINSTQLNEYIRENKDEYHCFAFIPYMFGTTYWGIKQCPEKSVLIPCFHDESYADMKLIKDMTQSVKGIVFNAKPELDLANRLYDIGTIKRKVIGLGIDSDPSFSPNVEYFRKKFNIYEKFVLYAGRKDKGKNVDELITFFIEYKKRYAISDLKMVMLGGGSIDIPPSFKDEILDLGFVSTEDKLNAYTAASIFCNPSKNESFSIVIMESWLQNTPIIVNGECEVTKNFCKESNAGLYYNSFEEFCEVLKLLLNNEKLLKKMGSNGRKYVVDNFSWNVIVDNYIQFFSEIYQ